MVDLNICRPGDILSSSHGAILKYIESLGEDDYMDHKVQYLKANNVDGNGKRRDVLGESYGSRDRWGFVYKKNRKESDHNIVEIRKALIIERKK
tara:strand:- start:2006 stop:2287 length:282 start_codon:yes stop_codon:yes gene_type:complete